MIHQASSHPPMTSVITPDGTKSVGTYDFICVKIDEPWIRKDKKGSPESLPTQTAAVLPEARVEGEVTRFVNLS